MHVLHSPALGQLVVVSECVRPGRELRLQCTVVGRGSTVWKGTAFDCPEHGNEIVLLHSRFESGTVTGVCNSGMIIGRSLNRTSDGSDSVFTSQLTIHLPLLNATNSTLDGRTIECIYDNGVNETNVGTHTVAYTREGTYVHFMIILNRINNNTVIVQLHLLITST